MATMRRGPAALSRALAGVLLSRHSALSDAPLRGLSASATQSAATIKKLRERSGAPIADVKAMLVANDWDVERAFEALRKKGLAAAAKKASRHASEGLIGASFAASAASASSSSSSGGGAGVGAAASSSGGAGSVVVVELNSETDFVARNALFQSLVRQVMAAAHTLGPGAVDANYQLDLEQLLAAKTAGGALVSEAVTSLAAQVGENVRLRRAYRVDSGDGLLYTYVHQAAAPGLGKLAAVVLLRGKGAAPLQEQAPASPALAAAGEGLAMHVAGMRPAYLNRAAVPADVLEHERSLLSQQLQLDPAMQGKPAQVLAKIVEGRLSKTLADWCLHDQRYVLDDSATVQQMLQRLGKELGHQVQVGSFLRVSCGEGLDAKGSSDFAAEVARIVSET